MPKKPYPSQTLDRYIVRLPAGMRDEIARAAKINNRSMNAEMVARLQETFAADKRSKSAAAKLLRTTPQGDPLESKVSDLESRLAKLEQKKGAK